MSTYYHYHPSPLGPVLLQSNGTSLTALYLPNHKGQSGPDSTWIESAAPFAEAIQQLTEYFVGQRQQFDVPRQMIGTPFQQRVWEELVRIPFGTTISYGELARRVGQPNGFRAVGNANGRNPISIIVPCHRVIGANKKLTGYAGGVEKKEWLLAWERQTISGYPRNLFDATGG